MQTMRRAAVVLIGLVGIAALLVGTARPGGAQSPPPSSTATVAPTPAQSADAFRRLATVLQHPRCANCHSGEGWPRQGDEGRRHDFRVVRGPDDKGAPGARCRGCHAGVNAASDAVPGAHDWHVAPLSMTWDGLSSGQLCRRLLDRSANGNRDANALVRHMTDDPLVTWAWTPGKARAAPPVPRDEFLGLLATWVAGGAACPD